MPFPSLTAIGSAASGIGSLASAFGIGGDKGPGFTEQRNNNATLLKDQTVWNNYHATKYRAEAVKDLGLHPLTALGISPSGASSTSVHYGQKQSPDLAAAGQGIDRALNAGRTSTQRKLDELAIEKAQLSNDYLKTQIAGSQKALLADSAGAVPAIRDFPTRGSSSSQRDSSRTLGDLLKAWKSNQIGIDDGVAPRHKYMIGSDGRKTRVLNTEVVGDNEILMLYDFITNTLPDELENAAMRDVTKFKKLFSRKKKPYTVSRPKKGYSQIYWK